MRDTVASLDGLSADDPDNPLVFLIDPHAQPIWVTCIRLADLAETAVSRQEARP